MKGFGNKVKYHTTTIEEWTISIGNGLFDQQVIFHFLKHLINIKLL